MAKKSEPQHPHYAETEDVEAFAHELPESYLECRELGHIWRPFSASLADNCYERTVRCTRCKTRRHEVLSLRGTVISRRMEYAEGYLTKNIGRIVGDGRDVLRLESITRLVRKSGGHVRKVS